MERQVSLRTEADSFYIEESPLLPQQSAEAPACLESIIMLISGDGHKHKTLLLKINLCAFHYLLTS